MQDMLRRGVVSIQAGERDEGKHLLTLVVQLEPDNAVAWLWLASVADSETERLDALQRVVQINPDNVTGRRAQALLRREVIREVASRIPPPAPRRTPPSSTSGASLPVASRPAAERSRRERQEHHHAAEQPRSWQEEQERYAREHRRQAPAPERPRSAGPGCLPLLVFGLVAALIGIAAGTTFILYNNGNGAVAALPTATRVIVERTRPPATPRPPTQLPLPSATLAPPPPPTRTPNPRFGACGREPQMAAQATFLCVDSELGDIVGLGRKVRLTPADGEFTVGFAADQSVQVHIAGADPWDLFFQVPYGLQMMPGGSFERIDLDDPVSTDELGLVIRHQGTLCGQVTGHVAILALQYQGDQISLFAADFEQHCAGDPPGLYGTILYQAGP